MPTYKNPDNVRAPQGSYSHVAEVKSGGRMIFIAGQVGVDKDGNMGDGFDAQAEIVFQNIKDILASEGMDLTNVVKMTTFLVNADDTQALRGVRDKMMDGAEPPNTLCIISRLADPKFLIEIEAVAAED